MQRLGIHFFSEYIYAQPVYATLKVQAEKEISELSLRPRIFRKWLPIYTLLIEKNAIFKSYY